eukprot:15436473-Alexandrium_andersonii.AAC.1
MGPELHWQQRPCAGAPPGARPHARAASGTPRQPGGGVFAHALEGLRFCRLGRRQNPARPVGMPTPETVDGVPSLQSALRMRWQRVPLSGVLGLVASQGRGAEGGRVGRGLCRS